MKPHPVAAQVEQEFLTERSAEALKLLDDTLASDPAHPDLLAMKGITLMYQQQEDAALDLLGRAGYGNRARKLAKLLAEHLTCRRYMSAKVGVKDPLANHFLSKVRIIAQLPPDPVGISITACLIVKDEEANLGRCLESIKGFVDEIVVVDTGSSDRTVEIAQEYGAKIDRFDWCDDFAAARNHALKLATGNWILWIDADEELHPDSAEALKQAVVRPQFGGYSIQIVNFTGEQGDAAQYVHQPVRLFRNVPGVRFTGRIHEQVVPSLQTLGLPWAALDGAKLLHHGYRPSILEEKSKVTRTVEILQKELQDGPVDHFHWFNLANAQTVAGNWPEAEEASRKCIELMPDGDQYGPLVYQFLSTALLRQRKFQEALAACDQADRAGHGGLLNEFERANILLQSGLAKEALVPANRCLALDWPEGMTGDLGIAQFKRYVVRGQILTLLDRHEEALEMFDQALEANPDCEPALLSKATALERAAKYDLALAAYDAAAEKRAIRAISLLGAGRCAAAIEDHAKAADRYETAFRENPQEINAWKGWVEAAETLGEAPRMARAYSAYATEYTATADVLVNWARACEAQGNTAEAIEKLEEAIRLDPAHANAMFNLGDVHYRNGEFLAAAQSYEAGLRVSPGHANGWFVLGNCLAQMGLGEGAKLAYKQALNLNPNYVEAKHNLEIVSEAA